jgi:chitodextrinase/exonuclease III
MVMFLLFAAFALASTPVRVATWNVETLGNPGDPEYEAALDVALRLGADVLCFNEIGSAADAASLATFVVDSGYATYAVAGGAPFGSDRSACLSDYPLLAEEWTAADISGDPNANDITRNFLAVTVSLPDSDLVLISSHYKSGSSNEDELRRAVEVRRTQQLFATYSGLSTVFFGDLNADVNDGPGYPATFTSLPTSLPASWELGSDLQPELAVGLLNDPFALLSSSGVVLDAAQVDGSASTRPSSGRRLDYIVVSADLADSAVAEVYNSELDATSGLLSWTGLPLDSTLSLAASDHLPVVADLVVGPPNVAPMAAISGPTTAVAGTAIRLDGGGSSDPDGNVVGWTWDFGDGQQASGPVVDHNWAAAGSYTVQLQVTDDAGATGTFSIVVEVQPPNLAPVSQAGGPYTSTTRRVVRFSGLGSTDADGTIVSYQWRFGDGTVGTGPKPTHLYTRQGNYTATLVVVDNDGASHSSSASVRITRP